MTSTIAPWQIQVHNLHKYYRDGEGNRLHILKGLDFQIAAASTTAILGASGVGKSTLMHILGALDHADEGEILIDGANITRMSREECARYRNQQIGFVFQFHHLLQDFTAVENVAMPLRINQVSASRALKKAAELLKEVGLGHRLQHKPAQLSGGEQQRVAIARAIVNEPKILFADEPTGNLDQETGLQVLNLLLKLNLERGLTLIIISHNAALADALQCRYRLNGGVLKLENTSTRQTHS